MRAFTLIAPLTLWVWSAVAFFPLVTEEHCVQVGGCLGPSISSDNVAVTIKISQRQPKNVLPHNIRISQYLKRLNRKYQASVLSKRGNQYNISHSTTPTQANSVAIDQDGTDFSYFATVKIGSAPTPMYMLLDTGASNTWVMGKECKNSACQNHNNFDSSLSTTFKSRGSAFRLFYGSGNVSGTWASDSVSIAGQQLTLDFGIANSTSPEFLNFPFDGILGLATAANDYPPFLSALKTAKLLKTNIFAMNLNRGEDGTNDGEMTFGDVNRSKYTGELGFTSLSQTDGSWTIKCDGISIGNKDSGIPARNATVDTGTSYMFMTKDDAKAFHSLIQGAKLSSDGVFWLVPCAGQSDVQLTFNGRAYTVPTKDWVGNPTPDPSICVSNIYPGSPVDGYLLGDTFLKNVYSVFDFDQKRIGFAEKAVVPLSTVNPTATNTGTPKGFDAAITSTSPSAQSAAETGGASPSPSVTTKGASSRFTVNFFTASALLLVAITFG